MPPRQLSTRQQRFAPARLPGPHLTRSRAPFPRRSPPSVFSRTQLEVVWSLPPQGDPEGQQSSISCAAPHPARSPTPSNLPFRARGATVPVSYRPRSSLPAALLAWLADRRAHLAPPRPPRQGGTPPLSLEVRLDAVAAVILDGLSDRRAGRMSASPRPRSATAWICCLAPWHARVLPARRDLHQQPRRAAPVAGGDACSR
jgi:hypothetical protein